MEGQWFGMMSDEERARAYELSEAGLTQTLLAMVEAVAATSPSRFETALSPIDGLFSADAERSIIRMLQECLRNVVQHAKATESWLTIERQPASVILTVRDNGQGFDAHASRRARHAAFGLDGLAQQVRSLGGALSIASAPGEGTTITIILDVPDTRVED
jgi:signal transduction histidine kinase